MKDFIIRYGGMTGTELIAALDAKNVQIGGWMRWVMEQSSFTTSARSIIVPLVMVTVSDLGYEQGFTVQAVMRRAEQRLELCPASLAAHLRLEDADQADGQSYLVASLPITDTNGDPALLRLSHNDGALWLNCERARPDDILLPDQRIVFATPDLVTVGA